MAAGEAGFIAGPVSVGLATYSTASILSTQVYTRLPVQKRRTPQTHITRIVAETAGARLAIKK